MSANTLRAELKERERRIEQELPLVRSLARRYANRGEGLEDLVQVGTIGLIKAVDRFEPDRGVAFIAFAIPNIIGEIKRHLRDRSAAIRIPRRSQEISTRIRITRGQLTADLHRDPTFSELAAAADVAADELAEAIHADHARAPLALADVSGADRGRDESEATDDRLLIAGGLRSLHPRERQAVSYRYFADLSQTEIAARLGISQTQASRLIASALAKLHDDFEGKSRCAASEKPLDSRHGDSRSRRGSAARRGRRQDSPALREA
jgi:RNA polymerase sigma-B factor